MNRVTSVASFFALLLLAAPARADLDVVATLPDLGAIAEAVGGEHVDVDVMASPSEDPHYVDPRPSHLVTLSRADVLIANGLELETGWLPPLQLQARNRDIQVGGRGYVEAAGFVTPIGADRAVDRSMGDVHPGGNPHFTFDPRAVREIAAGLAALFAGLDPDNGAAYEANLAAFTERLDTLIAEQAARFGALPAETRRAVVYHDSLPYLLDWLTIEQVTTVEPLPGVPPDPGRVAEVVGLMRSEAVPLMLQETYYPRNTSSRVAELAGAELVVLSGGTDVDTGEDYVDHVAATADAIYAALQ